MVYNKCTLLITFLFFFCAALLYPVHKKDAPRYIIDNNEVEFILDDSPVDENGNYVWLTSPEQGEWTKGMDSIDYDDYFSNKVIWLRVKLPPRQELRKFSGKSGEPPVLMVFGLFHFSTVYQNASPVFSYVNDGSEGLGIESLAFELEESEFLYIRCGICWNSFLQLLICDRENVITNADYCIDTLFEKEVFYLILAAIVFLSGLIGLFVFIFRFKLREYSLLYFGIFSLFLSLWQIIETLFLPLYFISVEPDVYLLTGETCFFIFSIFLALFYTFTIGRSWKKLFLGICFLLGVLIILRIIFFHFSFMPLLFNFFYDNIPFLLIVFMALHLFTRVKNNIRTIIFKVGFGAVIFTYFVGFLAGIDIFHFDVFREVYELGIWIFYASMCSVPFYYYSLKEKKIKAQTQAFSRFVPYEFLTYLDREHIEDVLLGDQIQEEMTILFSDIRSFTTLSEKMTPAETFAFLNEYLGTVSPVIKSHRGFIDKFIGDAIMALFPRAQDAVEAALEMQKTVSMYNDSAFQGRVLNEKVSIGIGIHTGTLMLGTIGTNERMESTVISDAVNLGARLEGLTKFYGSGIIVSEKTCKALDNPEGISFRDLDVVRVKGKREPVRIFEIIDPVSPASKLKLSLAGDFQEARRFFYNRDFNRALELFSVLLKKNADDKVLNIYIERCNSCLKENLNENWDGVRELEEK